jgi:hypothetical protein
MVIKPCSVRDSKGKVYIYVETNILEMAGYQADGTHSELYKIAAGRHIQLELGDQAEQNTRTERVDGTDIKAIAGLLHRGCCRLMTNCMRVVSKGL